MNNKPEGREGGSETNGAEGSNQQNVSSFLFLDRISCILTSSNFDTQVPRISFGFKSAKGPSIKFPSAPPKKPNDREFIKSIDAGDIEATIKKEKEADRIIPLPVSTKSYREKLMTAATSNLVEKKEIKQEDQIEVDTSKLSLEERAALEIINDLKQKSIEELNMNYVIPNTEGPAISGAKEASMDDYENVPIIGYGLAMLRGMGLKEEKIQEANNAAKHDEFKFRPKGMGLGADSTVKPRELKIKPKAGQILSMKKGAHVVVLGGGYKDFYGEVS